MSPKCTFCEQSPETTIHIFKDCIYVQKLWEALAKWLKYMYEAEINPSTADIILNNFRGPLADTINIHLLIVKYFIYKCKVANIIPKFNKLSIDIHRIKMIEKFIAVKNRKPKPYNTCWVNVHENLL